MARPGGKEVGRVAIRVVPDSTRFNADLRKTLTRIENSNVVSIPLTIDTRQATVDISRFKRRWDGSNIELDVDAKTLAARADLDELTRKRKVDVDTTNLSKVRQQILSLSSSLSSVLGTLSRIGLNSVGIAAIGATALSAIAGVGALIVALGRLSGAAGLIPAALGGAGAVLGTLVSAFSGVGAALKASTATMTSSGQSARVSEIQLAQAQQTALQAQKALTQARADAAKQLRDLANSVVDAQLAQRQSTIDLQTAQDAYNQSLADPSATAQQRAQALLTFEQAQQQLKEQSQAASDLQKQKAAADKAGVKGAANVVQAQQSLVSAQLAVIQAQQKSGGAVNAYAAALAKLSPSARIAVGALVSLRDRLSAIRLVVQENFFAGFSTSILNLAGTLLPQLGSGLGSLASALGGLTKSLFGAIQSAASGGVLKSFLDDVARAVTALRPAMTPLIGALTTLGAVGGKFLPALSASFVDASTKFADFLEKSAKSGALQAFIQGGITGFHELNSVLGGFGSVFAGLFRSVSGTGADPLASLAKTLHAMADVINTPTFQKGLKTIFEGASAGASGLGQALAPIGHLLSALAPTIAQILASSGRTVGSLLGQIADALAQPAFAKGLTGFFTGIQQGLLAIGPALPGLASAFGAIGTALGQVFAALGPQIATLIPPLVDFIKNELPGLVTDLQILLPILIPVLATIVQIIANIVGLGTPFAEFVQKMLQGGDQIGTIVDALHGKFGPLVQIVETFVVRVANGAQLVGKTFGQVFGSIGDVVRGGFLGVVNFIVGILNKVVDTINGLIGGINSIAGGLKTITGGAIDIKLGKLPHIPQLASGADLKAGHGGVLFLGAENGRNERVIDEGLGNRNLALQNTLLAGVISRLNGSGLGSAEGGGNQFFVTSNDPLLAAQKTAQLINRGRKVRPT